MITGKQAEAIIVICKTLAELPEGYTMKVDRKTHTILVSGPNLGFCITEKAMEEGYYIDLFQPVLAKLIECEADYQKDPSNPCWQIEPSATIEKIR